MWNEFYKVLDSQSNADSRRLAVNAYLQFTYHCANIVDRQVFSLQFGFQNVKRT